MFAAKKMYSVVIVGPAQKLCLTNAEIERVLRPFSLNSCERDF